MFIAIDSVFLTIYLNVSAMQIGAISSGIQPGLTMVVGPPGTGKTDTAVQILNVLYHNCPSQRTLIITHSNQALNDLFEKIMQVRGMKFNYLNMILFFLQLKKKLLMLLQLQSSS